MKRNTHWLFKVIAYSVFFFLVAPLLIVVVTSFGTKSTIEFPITGFTLDWYANVFKTPVFRQSAVTSLWIALISTATAMVIGVPATYYLSRFSTKGRHFLRQYFLSPTFVPALVIGYVLYQLMVIRLNFNLYFALWMGHMLLALPYVIRMVGGGLERFDSSIEEAAWTLGETRWSTFMKVVLPNLTSSMTAAFLLSMINSFNNIPVSLFLSGPGVQLLPVAMMNHVEYNYDPTVSALSVLLMLFTGVLMWLLDRIINISNIV